MVQIPISGRVNRSAWAIASIDPNSSLFAAPEGRSPFGKGGINPCLEGSDDPINHSAPQAPDNDWVGG